MQLEMVSLSGTDEPAEGVRELSSSVSAVVIAHSVTFLTVWLVANRRRLVVYRSPIVSLTGELFSPAAEILNVTCHTMDVRYEDADSGMMWGKGVLETYALFPRCPGGRDHVCCHDRDMVASGS